MSRMKSKKYSGVYLNQLQNKDIIYSITYKDEFNKLVRFTVGKKSEGITEIYAYNKRNEFINQVRLGEDPIAHKKKRNIITIDNLAKVYFDDKRCMRCENCKAFDKLSAEVKKTNNSLVCTYRKVKTIKKNNARNYILHEYSRTLSCDISPLRDLYLEILYYNTQGSNALKAKLDISDIYPREFILCLTKIIIPLDQALLTIETLDQLAQIEERNSYPSY